MQQYIGGMCLVRCLYVTVVVLLVWAVLYGLCCMRYLIKYSNFWLWSVACLPCPGLSKVLHIAAA